MKTIESNIASGLKYVITFQGTQYDVTSNIKELISKHKTIFSGFGLPPYDNVKETNIGSYITICNNTNEFNVDSLEDNFLELTGYITFEYLNGIIDIYVIPSQVTCIECDGDGGSVCDECGNDTECKICEGIGSYKVSEYWHGSDIPEKIHIKTIDLNQGELF